MSSVRRADRVAREIQAELSRLSQRELKDPRVQDVTFTRVELSEDLREALTAQKTQIHPGDVVLLRTGAIQFWDALEDREQLTAHDSAGLSLEGAKWLVEEKGSMMIGSDTSGLEYGPSEENAEAYQKRFGSFMPVHNYLLIEQGVHIAEFHYLEKLANTKTWEFCYICSTAKIRGTTAGFALRPIAVR